MSRLHANKPAGFEDMMFDRNSAYHLEEDKKQEETVGQNSPKINEAFDPGQLIMDRNKSYISKNSLNERQSQGSHDFSEASQELIDIQNGKKKKESALDLKNQNTSNENDAPFKNIDPTGIFQQCVDPDVCDTHDH